jgi:hypothetical protein
MYMYIGIEGSSCIGKAQGLYIGYNLLIASYAVDSSEVYIHIHLLIYM